MSTGGIKTDKMMPKEIGEAAVLAIQNEIRRLEDKINGRFCAPLGDWQKVIFEERVEHLKMAITAIRWSTDYNGLLTITVY